MRGRIAEFLWQSRLKLAGRPLTQPGCGRCGYPVHGLPGPICPECGADHRTVGISHPLPPLSPRTRRLLFLLPWTIALVALAFLLNPILLPLTPRDLSNHRDYVITLSSQPDRLLNVRQIGYGWGWKTPYWVPQMPRTIVISLRGLRDGGPYCSDVGEIIIQPGGSAYAYAIRYDSSSSEGRKVHESRGRSSPDSIQQWLQSMTPEAPADQLQNHAADLYLLATPRPFTDPPPPLRHLQITSITGGPESAPAYHGQPWLIVLWLLLYLAGAVTLWRRTKRKPAPK